MKKPGPKKVVGGVDDGTEWESIEIPPNATPKAVAGMLMDSFNTEWMKELRRFLALAGY